VSSHRFTVEAELLRDLLDRMATAMQLDYLLDDLRPQAAGDAPRGGASGLGGAI